MEYILSYFICVIQLHLMQSSSFHGDIYPFPLDLEHAGQYNHTTLESINTKNITINQVDKQADIFSKAIKSTPGVPFYSDTAFKRMKKGNKTIKVHAKSMNNIRHHTPELLSNKHHQKSYKLINKNNTKTSLHHGDSKLKRGHQVTERTIKKALPLKCRVVAYHNQTSNSRNNSAVMSDADNDDEARYISLCLSSSNSTDFADQVQLNLSDTTKEHNPDTTGVEMASISDRETHKMQPIISSPLAVTRKNNESMQYISNKSNNKNPVKIIHIGGLFELSNSPSIARATITGQSELAAAQMAIDHVNDRHFIPGYQLHMYHGDTKCDPGYGADAFYDMMYKREKLLMLIATSCSEVAKMLGEIVPYWNLVMVSHAATSPALSDREKYPGFFRLSAADSSHNPARKSFIQYMGWNTVATMIQDIESLSLANNEMTKDFEAVNISVKATMSFRDYKEDLHAKMIDLKESDARIIIGSFHEEAARHVFCEAYHMRLYGSRYVWMLLGSYSELWWTYGNSTNCTTVQLKEAVEGHFTVDSLTSIIGIDKSISGLTTDEFLKEYSKLDVKTPRSMYAQLAYDSVWAIALTLKSTLNASEIQGSPNPIENFSYKNGQEIYNSFVKQMDSLEFTGVSGPISFDGPDRRGVSVIEQNQQGQLHRVALYYPENSSLDFNCVGCQTIIWQGDKIPVDKTKKLTKQERILDSAYFAVCVASLSGMAIAFIFLAFNLHYRKLKYIKLSSPKLNNVAAVGCVFVYVSVILLGVDDRIVPDINYIALCMGRAYLWVAGFSLAFGAMFAKTYRVHQIFRRANSGILRSKLLKDSQLLLLIGGLLLLDSIVMTLWIVIDPMEREVRNLSAHPSLEDPDLLYIPQLSRCNCTHLQKWMGSLYAYKGLLLLFGVYMAWETRHVQIPALNDSQYIGMNIYNVVLSSVTVVVLSTGLTDKPTLSYVLISALIIISTTGMLGLLFFPKIYDICKNKGSPIVTTSGMTIEGNTRRFMVDERKEKYYRAEVENRFLKRKLTQLDQEITRLERLLQMPSDGYLKANEESMYLLPDTPSTSQQASILKRNLYPEPKESDPPYINKVEEEGKLKESLLLHNSNIIETSKINEPFINHGDYCCCQGKESDFYQNCNNCIKAEEPEITSDMGHTDVDFEEMMSEMGPPGMLTLIFNNDHVPQPQSPHIINQDHCININSTSSSRSSSSNSSGNDDINVCHDKHKTDELEFCYSGSPFLNATSLDSNSVKLSNNTQDSDNIFIYNNLTDSNKR